MTGCQNDSSSRKARTLQLISQPLVRSPSDPRPFQAWTDKEAKRDVR